jgi:hypothetical protein
MIKNLLNPFLYIAGGYSLLIGLLIIFCTSVIGYYSNIHFPDILSVKTSPDYPVLYYILQSIANWMVISTILYLFAIVFSKSKIRLIDIFGTQALARFPYLFAALIGFSNSMDKFSRYILWQLLEQGKPVVMSAGAMTIAIILIIVTLFLTVWMLALMFNAFKVAANIKGSKLIITFIIGLILSIIISVLTTNQLIKFF